MTDPVALATTIWGDGERRALLIHGLASASSTWWRVGPQLAELGFTVVAPDLRGHGKSPKAGPLSIESHRDDVLLLGGGWDLLIGHSFGGAIATAVVTASSGFAAKLVLEDPAIDSNVTGDFIAASPEPMAQPTVAAVAAANPHWDPTDVELKVEALVACGPEIAERTMADAAPWDLWPAVADGKVPTLIVAADPDLGTLVTTAGEARIRPSVALTRIAGAGHSVHRDAFGDFMSVVQGFLET